MAGISSVKFSKKNTINFDGNSNAKWKFMHFALRIESWKFNGNVDGFHKYDTKLQKKNFIERIQKQFMLIFRLLIDDTLKSS